MPDSLDPTPQQVRRMGDAALDYIASFYAGLEDAPQADLDGFEPLLRQNLAPPPEEGGPFEPLLEQVAASARKAYNPAGPGYMPYVPGGGLYGAALGDLLACVTNRFVNMWRLAPALVAMEYSVVRWLCDEVVGYGPRSMGLLTSGGSLANFSAIVAARTRWLDERLDLGVLYLSDQGHNSVAKAARLAGIPARGIRTVPTDGELRMDPEALAAQVRADRAAGLHPFCVVASAGTTNTGAVDPLDRLADLCAEQDLWFHVDGAYGGFFLLTEPGRRLLAGIHRADSVTLDPHKGLFMPYGTGALVVRDGEHLKAAHFSDAAYLQDLAGEDLLPNFSEYGPELTRDFRGLRVWLPLHLHGVAAFRRLLQEKLDLSRLLYEQLSALPGFELPWEPRLTVVPFRYLPRGGGGDAGSDAFNKRLLERINASGRVFLSSTILRGHFMLRPCILNHRTHRPRVEETIRIIHAAATELDGEGA